MSLMCVRLSIYEVCVSMLSGWITWPSWESGGGALYRVPLDVILYLLDTKLFILRPSWMAKMMVFDLCLLCGEVCPILTPKLRILLTGLWLASIRQSIMVLSFPSKTTLRLGSFLLV